jgi:UDP-N-acetylglucosamine 2-epimerase (non-hydrolysing)
MEDVLVKERPQLVIVFGDTNSTLAGALAASKLDIPVAHVEAGVRSFDRSMPEEINRVLADHVSSLLFVPTTRAVNNLKEEGIRKGVHHIGDVMVDSLHSVRKVARSRSTILNDLGLERKAYHVLTVHRAGNTDDPAKLGTIMRALGRAKVPVVFPVHPRTFKVMKGGGLDRSLPDNVVITDPVGYLDMVALMANARGVVTDSGGMQKESFILGTRCITIRENTEWPETFVEGRNRLVGLDENRIVKALMLPALKGAPRVRPFGSVGASQRIIRIINSHQ